MQNRENTSRHAIMNILNRDFVFGFFALFTVVAAVYALMPTLPIYLVRLGSSVREIGVLVGVFGASSLVFRLLVGVGLRRYSEKTVMMAGALLFTVTFLACLVLRPFWPFFAVRFFQGTAFSLLDTSVLALIVNVVPLAYRGQGLAIFLLAPTLALALAPSFGMFIINHYDFAPLFFTCAGLSLCAFFFSWKLQGQYRVRPEEESPSGSGAFWELKIIAPAVTSFLYSFVWGALIAFVPLYAIESGVSNPGYFFSSVAVMIIVGRAGARIVDTYSKEKIILTFISTSMIAMILLSFSKTLPMFVLVGLLWGTGSAFFYPASMAYAFDYADSSGGPAVGTFRALSDLGVAIGPAIMGMIIPLTGYRTIFLCLALVCLINLSYFQFCVRERG